MFRINAGALRAIWLSIAVIAAPALADTSKVLVTPLARSAAFWFRLDEVAPNLYSGTAPAPWMEVGRWAILEWRVPGTTAWKRAQDFVRVQSDRFRVPAEVVDPRMATMLFGLEEGKTYEYRVRFEGAGYPSTVFTGTFTTLTTTVPHGTTATVTITKDTPNISAAIKAALGSDTTPQTNKVIEIAGTAMGVRTVIRKPIASYYETGSLPFTYKGTSDGWLTLQTKAGHDVVFDGSDADYDVVNAGKWVRYTSSTVPASQNIYRTVVQYYDPANPNVNFAAGTALRPKPMMVFFEKSPGTDGFRLSDVSPGRTSADEQFNPIPTNGIATLNERATGTPNEGAFSAQDGFLYVHLQNGIDPNTVYMKIPVLKSPLDLSSTQYVRVEGLKIQYFRGPGDGWALFGGLHMDNATNVIIEGCEFKGLGTCLGNRTAFSSVKQNIVIKGNRFLERGLCPERNTTTGEWRGTLWNHMKTSQEEGYAIMLRGFGISVLDNTFIGMNNGVTSGTTPQTNAGQAPVYDATQSAHSEAWEIDNNAFQQITDDCLEMETWAVCVAATRNRMSICYDGWSVAPLTGGPQYFLRNTWVGRGEYQFSGYKQHMTKFGNDDPGDTGYKLCANNTDFSVNDNPTGTVLTGISASGASYNTYIYNNYIACDAYPVEWGDGTLGYPHIFNGNRYYAKRMADVFPGYGTSNCVALGRVSPKQGEIGYMRVSHTWNDWQMGKDVRSGYNWPAYQANPTDLAAYLHSTHSVLLPWTHDPDSKFSEGTHTLTDPLNGNFKPVNGSDAVGLGVPLANITVDCGPGWTAYEEAGRPTAGAVPGTGGASVPNMPPVITLPQNLTGSPGTAIPVSISYSDPDDTVTSISAAVSDSAGSVLPSTWENNGAGSAKITFTPPSVGTWRVAAIAQDDKGATTVAQIDIPVNPAQLPGGSLTISMTPSRQNAKPGEPIVYTVVVINPTSRPMTGVVLKQAIPAQVTLNAASAMLDGKPATITVGSGYFTLPLGDMAPNAQHSITITTVLK
ncbi:MAG TPA: hypothetical protein VGM51_12505 [Armatimonadota bacterium]|jgi:uncharacterized repeat protein (TIGR01451 family)